MNAYGAPVGPAPKTVVCYVCGRQYGTIFQLMKIFFSQCIKTLCRLGLHSFEIHLKQCKELWIAREAQKDPRERKPLPQDPSEGFGTVDRSNLTAEQLQIINDKSSQQYNNVSLSQCQWCGRTFLPEKLVVHNRSCTQENPAKRIGAASDHRSEDAPAATSPSAEPRPKTAGRPTSKSSIRIEPVSAAPAAGPIAGNIGSAIRPKKHQAAVDEEADNMRSSLAATHLPGASAGKSTLRSLDATEPLKGDKRARVETIRYLAERVDEVESAALNLVKSVTEIKALLRQLQVVDNIKESDV
jgi:hypothetical protein